MRATSLTPSATPTFGVDNNNRNTLTSSANSSATGLTGNHINSNKLDSTEETYRLRDNLRRMGCYLILDAYEDLKRWLRPQSHYTKFQLQELNEGDVLEHAREFFFGEIGVEDIIDVYQISINADTIRAVAGRMIAQAEAFIAGEDADEVNVDLSAIQSALVSNIKTAPVSAINVPANRGSVKKVPATPTTRVSGNVINFPEAGKNSAGLGDVPPSSDFTDMFANYDFSSTPHTPIKSCKYVRINRNRRKGDLEGQLHFPFLAELELEESVLAA